MANVSHATLTGADLHEPKGASAAASGQVYLANGAGSGAWTTITGLSFTGMIADFLAPSPPSGWLELDGTAISSTTYAALYSTMTVQQTGSRTGGSAIITGLASTSNIFAGYSVIGTGITAGTTVLSVDSPTQITMSANASSSGSATVIVSPWTLGSGTITLPNTTGSGRFRRSRTSTVRLGTSQASQNLSHTHDGVSGNENSLHSHNVSGTTDSGGVDHTHTGAFVANAAGTSGANNLTTTTNPSGANTSGASAYLHTHTLSITSGTESTSHTHSFTTNADGGTEARPVSIVVLTCVKT